jgi:hypothetical protein
VLHFRWKRRFTGANPLIPGYRPAPIGWTFLSCSKLLSTFQKERRARGAFFVAIIAIVIEFRRRLGDGPAKKAVPSPRRVSWVGFDARPVGPADA